MSGLIEKRECPDGVEFFLDGRQIHDGDRIELLLPKGVWLPGRFWRSGTKRRPRPELTILVGGPWEAEVGPGLDLGHRTPVVAIRLLLDRSILRWGSDGQKTIYIDKA